ncbi:MAG: glycosyltransferase [Endomicrobium sp.]|jgi:undecaprenyl-phosphate 4-deoxy-4-formamido-L-arabinose transferase|nr:glycosyltransferase [Endomicrobium sp.]
MKKMLSFVIPCYGSELTIDSVISEINSIVSERPEYSYEIICVNDCSPDNVIERLKGLVSRQSNVIVVDLAKNSGKHAAVMAGYSQVSGDYIINLDDDGQCPMDRLWSLIAELENGRDVIFAQYYIKKQSAFKNFGSNINNYMSRIFFNKPKNLRFENFSAAKRFIINEILKYKNPFPYLEGLYLRTTRNISAIKMEQRERSSGAGMFSFRKSISLWLNGFTAFSVKPLEIAIIIGFFVSFSGFFFALFLIIRRFFMSYLIPGYSSLMAAFLFLSGVIMIMLGLIGEYIGRMYISINSSPQYVIRNVYRSEEVRR